MKALSLWQPWASLVALGVKTLETRSWSTSYRGPLAIHAAKRPTKSLFIGDYLVTGSGRLSVKKTGHGTIDLPLGAIVATCTLVDVVPTECVRWHHNGINAHPHLGRHWVAWGSGPDLQVRSYTVAVEEHPYGDFTPGRYAWLLADIQPLAEPIPARGRQGLWNWQEAA